MYISRKVGEKGQVVIPDEIRREKGIAPGTIVYFDVEGDAITVRKQKSDSEFLEEFCNLAPRGKHHRFDIEKLIDQQYDERLDRMLKRK